MMRLLPILWGTPASPAAWKALTAARLALGVNDKIEPARALQGSPGRVLAIGGHPDWLCEYAYLPNLDDHDENTRALGWCFGLSEYEMTPSDADQLSAWLGMEVKHVAEEHIEV